MKREPTTLLTHADLERLGYSKSMQSLFDRIERGEFPAALQIGRRYFWTMESVEGWLHALERKSLASYRDAQADSNVDEKEFKKRRYAIACEAWERRNMAMLRAHALWLAIYTPSDDKDERQKRHGLDGVYQADVIRQCLQSHYASVSAELEWWQAAMTLYGNGARVRYHYGEGAAPQGGRMVALFVNGDKFEVTQATRAPEWTLSPPPSPTR